MKKAIQGLTIVGTGNVAFHLCQLFQKAGVRVQYLVARNLSEGERFSLLFGCQLLTDLADIPKNDLTLLCVPDDNTAEVISKIDPEIPLAYTSGSVTLQSVGARKNIGVFYPLQTFSKNQSGRIEPFPIFIESSNENFSELLTELARTITENVQYADSEKRRQLHLAAVWVNNFTNHILYHAQEITSAYNLDFSDLQPLLKESIHKLDTLSAFEAQTGPARRGDMKIIKTQSESFTGIRKEIYDLLSKSIKETYKK